MPELCFKCKEIKRGVTLCADDRLCPDCYQKNELALKAIREEQQAKASANANNSPVAITDNKVNRTQPPRTRLATAAARKESNAVVPNTSPMVGKNTASKLNTPPVSNKNNGNNNKLHVVIQELSNKVTNQAKTIESLTNKLNFVMSLLGIVDDEMMSPVESSSVGPSAPNENESKDVNLKPKTWTEIVASKPPNVTFSNKEVVRNVSTEYKNSVIAAVYADQQEDARRARTFIVHGLQASNTVSDEEQISNLCDKEFGVKLDITFNRRLGKEERQNNKPRPLLVALRSQDTAQQIVKLARQLRKSQDPQTRDNVYINANLTKAKAKMEYEKRLKRRSQSSTSANNNQENNNNQVINKNQNQPVESNAEVNDVTETVRPIQSSSSPQLQSISQPVSTPSTPITETVTATTTTNAQ